MSIFNRGRSHSTTAPLSSDLHGQRSVYTLHNAASTPNLAQEYSLAAQRIRETDYLRSHPHLLAKLYSALSENSLHPPEYSSLVPLKPRYAVYARPEEGQEKLPGYSPTVYREGLMCRKLELSTPYITSAQRSWQLVYVQLNNTQLNIYSVSPASSLKPSSVSTSSSNLKKKLSNLSGYDDIPTVTQPRLNPHSLPGTLLGSLRIDSLVRSYTLQYAEAGVATDYSKRPNVLRMRAEGEQFLLENASQEDLIAWSNTIQTGIDVALPIEDRALPRCRMIPRRRRRTDRNRTTTRDDSASNITTNTTGMSSYLSRLVLRIRSRRDEVKGRNPSASVTSVSLVSNTGSSLSLHNAETPESDAASDRASVVVNDENDVPNDPTNETPEQEEDEIYAAAEDSDDADDLADLIDRYADNAFSSTLEDDDYGSIQEKVWEPERTEQSKKSFLKYAYRCLYPLPATSSWVDKKVVHRGHKYIVTKDALQRISETPLVY
ncbi:hypothetical protein D0Z03_000239 [Geotrichum reessii]|nr:hypothetical protein D0Z03_000239 [Galactomyces reessii]